MPDTLGNGKAGRRSRFIQLANLIAAADFAVRTTDYGKLTIALPYRIAALAFLSVFAYSPYMRGTFPGAQ
jgi:hypothetical protein